MQIPNFIDNFLNKTPMYRVVIYSLLAILLVIFGESYAGILSYSILSLSESLTLTLGICLVTNFVFAKSLKFPLQYDSSIITSLILFFILMPPQNAINFLAITIASFIAIASKYILTYKNTHIFNPAALGLFAVTFLGYFMDGMSSVFWWIGNLYALPIVLLAGLLIVRKTRKEKLFLAGIIASIVAAILNSYFQQINLITILNSIFFSGPIIFFLTVMITEPHTIAKTKSQQIFYVFLIILLPVILSIAKIFNIPPELSLLIANFVSLIISGRSRVVLRLKSIDKLSDDIFEYNFENAELATRKFNFRAGEYMEWAFNHNHADTRGIRRYFTISSAPNENILSFATKFPATNESSFKKSLKEIKVGDTMYATQLSGEFVLPKLNLIMKDKNLIFVAGGIGITPFVSQLRDLLNRKEKRSIVLFYCIKNARDIVYLDLLKRAIDELGIKVVCVISDAVEGTPGGPQTNLFYETGYITKEILMKYTQNLHNEYFISGPSVMVDMIKKTLRKANILQKDIHKDYFPGF